MKRAIFLVPLALLLAFGLVVAWRLANPPDTVIRSKLEGRPLPEFALPAALPGRPGLNNTDFRRTQPRLLNIFASWCVPCIAEAPMLMELKRRGVPIEAIAVRDRPEDIADFLQRYGDPFGRIGADVDSRVQLALGSAGVPETFVIDGRGVVRFQHIGPIAPGDVSTLLAELEKAR
jgi:cytochrome c biogenesis protein CcmG/thiol:disulfide interchange protein DsbE